MCRGLGSLVPLQEASLADVRGSARFGPGLRLHTSIIVDAKALTWPLPYNPSPWSQLTGIRSKDRFDERGLQLVQPGHFPQKFPILGVNANGALPLVQLLVFRGHSNFTR